MVDRATAAHEVRARRRRAGRPGRSSGGRSRVGAVLLATALVGSALLVGAQHPVVLLPVGIACGAAALLLPPSRVSWLAWTLFGLAAYTLLQIVPLPLSWIAIVSPAAAEVWRGTLEPFGEPAPRWASLSVDTAATALEGVKWFAYACALSATHGWRRRFGSSSLALLVFASALLVALVTLAHGVLDASRIYGLFVPSGDGRFIRGPLVNGNTLASYLNLGFFAGAGVWLGRSDKPWQRFMPLGLLPLALGVLLTGSRAGVALLAIGSVSFSVIVLRQRRADWVRLGIASAVAIVVALAVAIAVAGPGLQAELLEPSLGSKVVAWGWALRMIADFPLFGVGRGAFETAFQSYRELAGREWTAVYAHAENFIIEWAADWGVPVALVAVAGIALAARDATRRVLREPLAAGLGVGLAALVLQNLLDLGLEVFAVAAAALVAFGALASSSTDDRRASWRETLPAPLGLALCVVVAMALGATPVKLERERVARAYSAFARSKSRDGAPLLREIRARMLLHPAEAYFPMVGALVARRTGGEPLRWLDRALELAPMNGTTHVVLAHVLHERGARRQALLHVRLAALYDATLRDHALTQAATWARTTDEIVAVFPRGLPGAELLEELCDKVRPEFAVGCWREAVVRVARPDVRHHLTGALLDDLEAGRPPCRAPDDARCAREVESLLGRLSQGAEASNWRTSLHRARLAAVRGDLKVAVQVALAGCPASPEASSCIKRALGFARSAKDPGLLAAVAERYLALHCGEPQRCAAAHDQLGETYADIEFWSSALRHFRESTKTAPTPDRWLRNAEAAARTGAVLVARLSLDRAARAGALSDDQRARVASVERLIAEGGASP